MSRRAGVLAHLSSIPGADLGPGARHFLDWLAESGFSIWQLLPIGPTPHSPYTAFSSIAGHPGFISAERLPWGENLDEAFSTFARRASSDDRRAFESFRDVEGSDWLDDWALFCAARARHGGTAWFQWESELRRRDPQALRRLASASRDAIATA